FDYKIKKKMTGTLIEQPLPSIPTIASYLKQGDERKKSMDNLSTNKNPSTETVKYLEDTYYPSVVSTSLRVFSKGDNNKEYNMPTTQHLQYNSPMALYSKESAEEQYRQQTAGINAQPIPISTPDRHFDPTKSKTLEYIKSGVNDEDFITPNFFDKVNQAEAPNVPITPEPTWAREARARSERARSKTPANYGNTNYYDQEQRNYYGGEQEYNQKNYIPQHPNEGTFYNPNQKYTSSTYNKISSNDYNKQKDMIYTCGPTLPSPERPLSSYKNISNYHNSQQKYNTYDAPPNKSYQFGGMDFIDHSNPQYQTSYYNYVPSQNKRASSVGKEIRPGYQYGGTDYRKENTPIGYNPNYHGHAAERPRLRSKYDADPRIPINNYVAPNVDGVDPVTLVGDTISNQKISRSRERSEEQKKYIGTIFAPAPGHTSALRNVSPPPNVPEPICYSTNVETLEKMRSKSAQPRSNTATPALQYSGQQYYNDQYNTWNPQYQDNYTTKEVNVKTLLTDEALRPIRRSHTPDWSHRSHQKHVAWQNDVVDPRYTRPEIHTQEPNWSRTVSQRRNHWENKCRDADARVQLPASFKVPPPKTPNWAHHANQKHQIWEAAANSTGINQNQQSYNYHYNNTSRPQEYNNNNNYVNNQGNTNYHYVEDKHSSYSRTATGEQPQHYETHSHKETHKPNHNVPSTQVIPLPPPSNYQPSHQQQENQTIHRTENRQSQFSHNAMNQELSNRNVGPSISLPPQKNYSSNQTKQDNITYHFSEDRHEKYSCNKTGEEPRSYETHTHRECHTPNRVGTPIQPISMTTTNNFKSNNDSNSSYHFKEDRHEKYSSTKTGEEPKSYETHSHREYGTPLGGIQKNVTYNYTTAPAKITNNGGTIQTSSWNKTTTQKTTTRESVERPIPPPRYNVVHDSSNFYKKETTNSSTKNVVKSNESRNIDENNKTTTYSCSGKEAYDRLAEMNETLPIGSISNTISNTSGVYKDEQGKDIQYKRELTTSADPGKEYQLLKEQETRVVEKPLEPGIISRHVTTKYYKKKTVTDSTMTK
uniref:ZM domain-containing protein n=2 Tax=Strongyloides stercoralis TaxID=6248 RepID=A0AAF5I2W0_STRER